VRSIEAAFHNIRVGWSGCATAPVFWREVIELPQYLPFCLRDKAAWRGASPSVRMVETGFGPIAILSEPVVAPAAGHPRPQTWSEGGKDNRISEITS
jgi:hypothetical protein